jgi:uncharacterized protein YbjT (DUF2867 family)
MEMKTILVLGATGTQGGAVCRNLSLKGGFCVIAITRNAAAEKARQIAQLPIVELAECDADSPSALEAVFAAHEPVHGVFSVQANDYTDEGVRKEITQGKLVVDLCERHGVEHLVYTSVAGLKPAELRDIATKIEIERYLHASRVPFTILRPTFFVENFFSGGFAEATSSTVGYPGFDEGNDRKQQYIYIDDLGMIAAEVLTEGESWFGRTLELAGDALTPSEIVATFASHTGRPMAGNKMPIGDFGELYEPLFVYMRDGGWSDIDIDGLRKQFPRLHTVKGALEHSGFKAPE